MTTKTTIHLSRPTTRVLTRRLADDPYARLLFACLIAGLVAVAYAVGKEQQARATPIMIERATPALPSSASLPPTAPPPTLPPTAAQPMVAAPTMEPPTAEPAPIEAAAPADEEPAYGVMSAPAEAPVEAWHPPMVLQDACAAWHPPLPYPAGCP